MATFPSCMIKACTIVVLIIITVFCWPHLGWVQSQVTVRELLTDSSYYSGREILVTGIVRNLQHIPVVKSQMALIYDSYIFQLQDQADAIEVQVSGTTRKADSPTVSFAEGNRVHVRGVVHIAYVTNQPPSIFVRALTVTPL